MARALLLGRSGLSEEQRWRLVTSLYGQPRSLVIGCLAYQLAAALSWFRTGEPAYAWLMTIGVVLVAARLAVAYRFARRRGGTPEFWVRCFLPGALISAGLWGGLAAVAALWSLDDITLLFVLSTEAGFAAGAAVRNNASPLTARAQIILSAATTAGACLASPNPWFRMMAPLTAIQIAAMFEIIRFLCQQTLSLLDAERAQAELAARLERLSATDGLTGIANRRAFDAALARECGRTAREGGSLALLIVDVDHFKSYNDRYGHPAGDDCLRAVAGAASRAVRRPADLAARFGGEEFVVLLPGAELAGAREVAERIRADLASLGIAHSGAPSGRLTVSIGVAVGGPGSDGCNGTALVSAADGALYRAKREGRDRIGMPLVGLASGARPQAA